MSNERDPRTDPKPGDALQVRVRWQKRIRSVVMIEINSTGTPWVHYHKKTKFGASRLIEWREWAKNAEVIHAAE